MNLLHRHRAWQKVKEIYDLLATEVEEDESYGPSLV